MALNERMSAENNSKQTVVPNVLKQMYFVMAVFPCLVFFCQHLNLFKTKKLSRSLCSQPHIYIICWKKDLKLSISAPIDRRIVNETWQKVQLLLMDRIYWRREELQQSEVKLSVRLFCAELQIWETLLL